jgi:hypothetical protein
MIRRRSLAMQIVLFVITFGIYGFYWFYSVSDEMRDAARDDEASPALWTVLLFVPIAWFYSLYKFSELYERWSRDKMNLWLLFVLWLVFSPAVWFIVQTELNHAAERQAPAGMSPV